MKNIMDKPDDVMTTNINDSLKNITLKSQIR